MANEHGNNVPPHDDMVEQATLGALLMDKDAIVTAIQYVRPDDFYSNANGKVFDAIQNLADRGLEADIFTVTEELRQNGKLNEVGGPAYVASLTNIVPSSANIEFYAESVQGYSLRRALIRVSREVISQAFDDSLEARLLLEETQRKIFELSDNRQTFSFKDIKKIVQETSEFIERLYNSKQEYTGIPSGFDDLDKLTSGFQPSELIIIGARPSQGKTALALSMTANIAIHNQRGNIPTAFFTLEMSDISLMLRLISSEAMIDANAIRTGFIKQTDYRTLQDAMAHIYDAPLYIVDMPNMKLLDLRAMARRLRSQQKVEIIFIDYLSLISSENYKLPRHEQIAEISRSLKSLARELKIPVVVLSQLTRDAEKERPNLASIRESGSIEQDADVVMFIHRKRESDKTPEEQAQAREMGSETDIILAKQRNGPVGNISLLYLSKYTKFVSIAKNQ
ncbi:MAG: replicative DNA helicase [Treponema sp.]|jgi:replicative DNA helicase|nr:replicative DNA helicase [Treponema sp.]